MKKIIIYILTAALAVTMVLCAGSAAEAGDAEGPGPWNSEGLAARQEEVHEAAELLRELGVAEDSDGIKALQEEWWRCETMKNARYLGNYMVTGYDPYCPHCCPAASGLTASGKMVTIGYTVAMSKDFPFGTRIYIEGLGVYEVQDRGVGAGVVDIAMGSHAECALVTGRHDVWVVG